jgi:hypothetical protein
MKRWSLTNLKKNYGDCYFAYDNNFLNKKIGSKSKNMYDIDDDKVRSQPSLILSMQPSSRPLSQSSTQSSIQSSTQPSMQPSALPLTQPSSEPSSTPSSQPSTQPSTQASRSYGSSSISSSTYISADSSGSSSSCNDSRNDTDYFNGIKYENNDNLNVKNSTHIGDYCYHTIVFNSRFYY